MDNLKDKDLREALRRKEAKRQPAEVPTDFCENVMREIGKGSRPSSVSSWRKTVAITLSVAASLAIVFMLTWQEPQPDKAVVMDVHKRETPTGKGASQGLAGAGQRVAGAEQHIIPQPMKTKTQAKRIQPSRQQATSTDVPQRVSSIDSLQLYIDKIEQELAHVDESLYIERMNKVIQADDRLQRIVNQFILHGIMSDEKPHTVQSLTPQNQEDNEE